MCSSILRLGGLTKSGKGVEGPPRKALADASLEGERINIVRRFILKSGLVILVLVVGLVLTGFGVHAILKPSVSAIFGIEIVRSGLFYVAVVALSLIVYLFLLVFAVRTWERFKGFLRARFPKAFKH